MQPGHNVVRPETGEGNGVWIGSNANSPHPQSIIFTDVNKTVFKKKSRRWLENLLLGAFIIILILFLGLCIALYYVADLGEKNNICFTPDCVKAAGKLFDSIDFSINPCDNFYQFACGNWRKTNPADDPLFINNWFLESFKIQNRDTLDYLRREDSSDEPKSVHDTRLVFRSCLDFESMEEVGIDTFWELMALLSLPRNPLKRKPEEEQNWLLSLARTRRFLAINLLIGISVLPSYQNSTYNQLTISIPEDEQVLPGAKWRWENKHHNEKLKRKLKDESESVLVGWLKHATKLMEYVMAAAENVTHVSVPNLDTFAYKLLEIQKNILNLEDDEVVKNHTISTDFPELLTIKELQFIVDNATSGGKSKLQWKTYIETLYEDVNNETIEFDDEELIMVNNRPHLELLSKLLSETDDEIIEFYIWWNVVFSVAPHINEDLKEMKETFLKTLLGVPIANTRSDVCRETVYMLMKIAVGYQVMEYVNENVITEIHQILRSIQNAFANFIFQVDWMDEPTKFATVEKLYSMSMYVGYPNFYKDFELMDTLYANVSLLNDSHLANILNLLNEQIDVDLATLFEINNSSNDFFDPIDINAYYDPSTNSITVPYAITHQPYYQLGLQALNYGAIGTVLGHEITHGLDNSGRMYDKFGNYREWWSKYSSEEYSRREVCFRDTYNNFYIEAIDSTVNGYTTLGENIADDGGIRDSLAAYRSYVKKNGEESKLPGFLNYTHDQLFFLSFGNIWCSEYSDNALRRTLEDDEHSPNFVRVLVVLQNFQDFADTWKCPIGSYMNPVKKCKLW